MAVARAALGLATGFRAGMEQNRQRAIEEENRRIGLEDVTRQRARQDRSDQIAEEERGFRIEDRRRQAGLRDLELQRAEEQRMAEEREAGGRALYGLASALDDGADPEAAIAAAKIGGQPLPPGTRFDPATGDLVISGPDGAEQRHNAKQLRGLLEPYFGSKEKPEVYNTSRGLFERGEKGSLELVPGTAPAQEPQKPLGLMSTSAGIYDPNTKTWIQPPKGMSPADKPPTWPELRVAREQARKNIESAVAGIRSGEGKKSKPLTPTEQEAMVTGLAAVADEFIGTYGAEYGVGENQITKAVVDAWAGSKTLQQTIAEELDQQERGTVMENGRARRETRAEFETRVRAEATEAFNTDQQARRQAADQALRQVVANNSVQRVDEVLATGGRPGRGARTRDVITTPDKLKGATGGIQFLRSNPSYFEALMGAETQEGMAPGFVTPAGKAYILVGDELREIPNPRAATK